MVNTGIITNKKPTLILPKRGRVSTKAKQAVQKVAPPPLQGGWEGLFTLRNPTDKEFKQICLFITEFELDNRDLKKEQFIVALSDNELIGFGRLREHTDCLELCSLGVVTSYRRQGIGKAIVTKLIENFSKNIYLVCIIPDFFIPFGFQKVEIFPVSIQNKIEYCTSELIVPEPYVAMLLSPKIES